MRQIDLTERAPLTNSTPREEGVKISGTLPENLAEVIESLAHRFAAHRGGLLPLLHAVQHELGYIDDRAVPLIARALNLSRADVHGVVTFYPDFRRVPPGRHVVKICRAEACQARGGAAIEAQAAERLATPFGTTRADGAVTLEPVYCLGLCAIGPNALVDERPVARLDAVKLDAIAREIAA